MDYKQENKPVKTDALSVDVHDITVYLQSGTIAQLRTVAPCRCLESDFYTAKPH